MKSRSIKSAKFKAAVAERMLDKMADHAVELIRAHEKQSRIAARAKEDSDEERAAFKAQENYEGQIGRLLLLFANPVFLLRLIADKLEGKPTGRQGHYDKDIIAACERTVRNQKINAVKKRHRISISDFVPVRSDAESEWFTTSAEAGLSRRTFNRTLERLGIATRPGKPGRPKKSAAR
jgi:hypothetical protein